MNKKVEDFMNNHNKNGYKTKIKDSMVDELLYLSEQGFNGVKLSSYLKETYELTVSVSGIKERLKKERNKKIIMNK
ncbi:hypothetical protein [Sulfurimonas sp. CS5]|uniref:hypothetical protein n=1 Tax=Sulfurimonas sp. CS5 TaxID=3391145 RepID=UPI0039E79495